MSPEAVLFDADGVLQRPGAKRPALLCSAFGCAESELSAWQRALFDIEDQALTGRADFAAGVRKLLVERGCPGSLDQVLEAWTSIALDEALSPWIRRLRARGVRCFLATNQERHRGTAMSRDLGFCQLFEAEFYSFAMGVAKPERAFFRHILDATGIPAERTLFVDDRAENVAAARAVGMSSEVVDIRTVVRVVEAATAG